jgi:hypothetical protein
MLRAVGCRSRAEQAEGMTSTVLLRPSQPPVQPSLPTVRVLPLVAVAIKLAALALLLVAVVYPDLGGLKSKGMEARLVAYPLGLVACGLLWAAAGRLGAVRPFSWGADVLCSLPILVDLLGNRLGLFDSVLWWDDLMHVSMHALMTAGVLWQFLPAPIPAFYLVSAAVAFGAVTGLGWEIAEYLAFMRYGVESDGAYLDTLGDLIGGTTGSTLAGAAVWFSRRRIGRAGPASAAAPLVRAARSRRRR